MPPTWNPCFESLIYLIVFGIKNLNPRARAVGREECLWKVDVNIHLTSHQCPTTKHLHSSLGSLRCIHVTDSWHVHSSFGCCPQSYSEPLTLPWGCEHLFWVRKGRRRKRLSGNPLFSIKPWSLSKSPSLDNQNYPGDLTVVRNLCLQAETHCSH